MTSPFSWLDIFGSRYNFNHEKLGHQAQQYEQIRNINKLRYSQNTLANCNVSRNARLCPSRKFKIVLCVYFYAVPIVLLKINSSIIRTSCFSRKTLAKL